MILYEVLNEQERTLAERTYAVWPDLEALMREHGVPAFTVDAHRPVGAFDLLGVSFATELGYTNLLRRSTSPGSRAAPRPHGRRTRWSSPAGTRRSTRSRSPTSSTPPCSATASRRCCEISAVVRGLEGRGPPGRARGAADAAGAHRRRLRARVLRRRVPARRPHQAGRAQPPRRAVAGRQAHRHGPRRVAVPEAAAGAARRDGARAGVGRDLPRLHPRLPVLPGRHDHPPGARALDHRGRRDGREVAGRHRLRGGRPALAVQRRPLRDRRDDARAWPTATRAPRPRCRCRRPGSTRSTSTWPTS